MMAPLTVRDHPFDSSRCEAEQFTGGVSMITSKALAQAACALAAVLPAASVAQVADEWQFQASIYAYLPSIGGTTTFPPVGGGSSASVDVDQILENLKFTFMGSFEAQKGRWGFFSDLIYLNVGDSKSASRTITIGGAGLPAGASADVDFDMKGWLWTSGGSFRAVSEPRLKVDLIAGARLLDVQQTLMWGVSGNVGSIALLDRAGDRRAELQNWDFIVGVKGRWGLGQAGKWFAPYYLDIGFGESEATVQAMAGVGYSFGWGDIVGAWRYIGYNMKSGGAIEDLSFSGPLVAAVFHW